MPTFLLQCGPKYQKSPQCGPKASFADLFGCTAIMAFFSEYLSTDMSADASADVLGIISIGLIKLN